MLIYGFTVVTYPEDYKDCVKLDTQLFADARDMELAIETLVFLGNDKEIETFTTVVR